MTTTVWTSRLLALKLAALLVGGCASAGAPAASVAPVMPDTQSPVASGTATAPTAAATTAAEPSPSPVPTPTPAPLTSPRAHLVIEPITGPSGCVADPLQADFMRGLLADLAGRDEAALARRMGSRFEVIVEATEVMIPPMSAAAGAAAIVHHLPDPFAHDRLLPSGTRVGCVGGKKPPADWWPFEGRHSAVVFTTGWGPGGKGEAWVYLAKHKDGTPYWLGIFWSGAGFGR